MKRAATSPLDALLTGFDRALRRMTGVTDEAQRPVPAPDDSAPLSDADRRESARLMRVNHAGEVSAQAL